MEHNKKYIRFFEAFDLGIKYGLAFLNLDIIVGKALHHGRKKGLEYEVLAEKSGVCPEFIDKLERSIHARDTVDLVRVLDELGFTLVLKKKWRKRRISRKK